MKLGAKLILAFLLVVGLGGLGTATAVRAFQQTAHGMELSTTVDELAFCVVQVQQFLTDVSATHDREVYTEADGFVTRFKAGLQRAQTLDPAAADRLAALAPRMDAFAAQGRRMAEAYITGGTNAGNVLMQGAPGVDGFDQLSEGLWTELGAYRSQVKAEVAANQRTSLIAIIVMVSLALFGSVGVAVAMSRYLAGHLGRLAEAAAGIARGELDHEVAIASRDELGAMARAFHTMIGYLQEMARVADALQQGDFSQDVRPHSAQDRFGTAMQGMIVTLRGTVSHVRRTAEHVGVEALQLSSAGAQLAQAVSSQGSSTEETSAAMAEMAANTRSVDGSAQVLGTRVNELRGEAKELAQAIDDTTMAIGEQAACSRRISEHIATVTTCSGETAEAARAGDAAVRETLEGMRTIQHTMSTIMGSIQALEGRSSEIGTILEVIDDIAEQTNLLALNAAIEAARAGEAGRGFAVVADEVRKLAERSAKATREIAGLVQGIQRETHQAVAAVAQGGERVQGGVALVERTEGAFARIAAGTERMVTMLDEVQGACTEQSTASEQILRASMVMDSTNRHLAAAIADMDEVAHQLSYATSEQRAGADQVVTAVGVLQQGSFEAASATEQVVGTAETLKQHAEGLRDQMAFFRTEPPTALATR